jgi:hypothetical protein
MDTKQIQVMAVLNVARTADLELFNLPALPKEPRKATVQRQVLNQKGILLRVSFLKLQDVFDDAVGELGFRRSV